MNDQESATKSAKATEPVKQPELAVTVLEKVKVGSMWLGKKKSLRLPKDQAETLAGLGKVRIDGI